MLDNNPEGQWFRKKFLGIPDERLSTGRFSDLCNESLDSYRNASFLDNLDVLIERKEERGLKAKLSGQERLYLLVGESGFGKSSLAFRILENHIRDGNFGLWVPPELVGSSLSWADLLNKYLNSLYPNLQPDSSNQVFKFISKKTPLLLVVDDVNRSTKPLNIVRKLVSWSTYRDDPKELSEIYIICPVWSQILANLSGEREKKGVIIDYLGLFSLEDGKTAIQRSFSEQGEDVADIIAEKIGCSIGDGGTH